MSPVCQSDTRQNREFLLALDEKIARMRVPLAGTVDLTWRCNLNCAHCYLGAARAGSGTDELGTDQWLAVIDEIAAAGCLYLLISGGEPLLREDFWTIYQRAKQRGMLVSVFTNGVRVTDRLARQLAEWPPQVVEVSIYGASEAVSRRVTGVAGALGRSLEGVRCLAASGVPVKLKTVLMTLNRHEISDMRLLAEGLGVDFRFDPAIIPRFDGDRSPLVLRVDPAEAVDLELADPQRLSQWREALNRLGAPTRFERLYDCGAGESNFYIGPGGRLQACLMVPRPYFDLRSGAFETGWNRVIPGIKKRRPSPDFACSGCPMVLACDFCPSHFALETGSDQIPSEYICSLAKHRYRAIMHHSK